MVFREREGLKELGERREREELWDLQENRESKASREILAPKESREKKVNNNITIMIIIMTKAKLIFLEKNMRSINNTMLVCDDSFIWMCFCLILQLIHFHWCIFPFIISSQHYLMLSVRFLKLP